MDQSPTTTRLPLSVTQQAMWVTWQLNPDRWEHIIQLALAVDGELELPRLRSAVASLLERHPVLLSRVGRDGEDMCLDWSGTAADAVPVTERTVTGSREEEVAAAQLPFDLAAGPLSRFEVLHGPDWTVLVITVHHIILDGASAPLLLDDLRRAYAGEELAPPDDLAPLVAHAERSWAAADEPSGEPLRAYWRTALADLPPARPLPVVTEPGDGPDAGVLDAGLARRLHEVAREIGVSYFTVLLGALFIALHHQTGSTDLIVSAPYHGRSRKELRDRVSYFVNVLPFRQRIRPTDSYADLLRELRSTVKAGLRHGDLPLPAILRSAGLLGPKGRQQAQEVVFQYWDADASGVLDVHDFTFTGEHGSCSLRMLDRMDVPDFRLTVMLTEGSAIGTRTLWKDPGGTVGSTACAALSRNYLAVLADLAAAPERTLAEATALLPAVASGQEAPTERAAKEVGESGGTVPVADAATVARLAAIWTEVLRVPDITPEDSFFELGGHSLIAATLLNRINDELAVTLTIRDLFDHPRLTDLATIADQQRATTAPEPAQPEDKQPEDSGRWDSSPLPASRFQEAIWLAERLDPVRTRYHIPLSWRVRGELDLDRLRAALALLVSRHEILRTRFTNHDGRLFQEIDSPWQPELAMLGTDELGTWFEKAVSEFDAAAGRLFAAGLATGPGGERILALCIHHLVLDGESVPLLARELDRCYRQEQLLPPRQYGELVRSQQSGSGRDRALADLDHCAAALVGAPSAFTPAALAVPDAPLGTVPLALSPELPRRLRPIQEAVQASEFMVLATALAAALHRWSGRTDLTFGVPVADRAGGDFAEVLGPCLNTVLLRSRCEPGSTLGELLHLTRERVIEAFEHQSAPFDELVRRLRPRRTAADRTPYLDCLLNSVGTTGWSTPLGEAELTSLGDVLHEEEGNKFGLTVTFTRQADTLLGTLAYRGSFLDDDTAAEFADDLAGLLNHFHDLRDEPVFARRTPEEN